MKKFYCDGYAVVFCVPSNGYAFFQTLEEAINVRDMISGGGSIYHATLERCGLNIMPFLGEKVRKSDGTPL